MSKKLELYVLDLINGKRKGVVASFFRAILQFFSWIFRFIVFCRNWAFDHGWLRRYTPPVPVVISIGNIVAGGTGKTPVTMLLAKEFYDVIPLAILARGYRAQAEKLSKPVILSRGNGPLHPPSVCGDEPYMLSQNLPKAFVCVGKDRHEASNIAAKAGAKLILLDDGMQHRHLARDFEVVVVDARDPFGHGYFLPRGFLREGAKSLARADLIILNNVHLHDDLTALRQQIAHYTTAPVIGAKPVVEGVFDLQDKPISSIQDVKVGLFCGIAHPDYFEKTVQELGAVIVGQYCIPDHMDFDPDQLIQFSKECAAKGAEKLICTEKDRVKIVEALDLALPIVWVRMHLALVEGKAQWEDFIQRVKGNLTRDRQLT